MADDKPADKPAESAAEPQEPQEPEGFSEEERALFEKLKIGQEGGMPMPTFIKPSDVRTRTASLAEGIFEQWHTLQGLVERHEPTLQRRWAGIKQKKKRKELLQAAARGLENAAAAAAADEDAKAEAAKWTMPETHRPDIDIWRDVREAGSEDNLFASEDPARRCAFLWPHLNLEDLSRTERPLLLMFSARGKNPPHAFAAADLERARFAMDSLALMPHYLNRYTMMFTDRIDPATYGELVPWRDLPEDSSQKWLFERRGIHPGEGLWLLEIQDVTYRFLVNVCKKILHDIPEDKLLDYPVIAASGEAPAEGAISEATPQHGGEYTSLITRITEEPYRSPARLDRNLLEHPVEARLQEARDHLLALREDPAYFAACLQDWATHRREQLLDANGNPHPILAKSPTTFWSRVVNRVVGTALLDVAEWDLVYDKVLALTRLLDQYDGKLDENADLPPELAFAFYALDHHVEQLKAGPFTNITMGLVASPPMRPYFQLVTPSGAEDRTLAITAVEEAPAEDSTRVLIRRLGVVQDEKQRQVVGLPGALDELEYHIAAHPEARLKITPWVANQLSSLAVFARVLRQIELFQPWAARFGADVQEKETREGLEQHLHRSVAAAGIPRLTQYEVSDRVVAMGIPEKGRFDYPLVVDLSHKAAVEAAAEQVRRAEVALDGFWGRVKVDLERAGGMTGSIKDTFGSPLRRFATTAAVAAAAANTKGQPKAKSSKTNGAVAKVNGEAEEASEESEGDGDANGSTKADSIKKIKVGKRELKVFNALFHEPFIGQSGGKPAEIPWAEFVHAMHAVGFTVTKLYGSAWLFVRPADADADDGEAAEKATTMLVQEPYTASNKILPTAARVIGRRLAWNLEWERATFELSE
ncbi:hypothetical protein RB595_005916 [Gaeumannomyces hyphopodioides]